MNELAVILCRFLLQHITELGYIADESLDALGLLVDKSSVLLLDHGTPTLIAFQKMYEKGMSGAAVKAEGHMVAHLSISDLRSASRLYRHSDCLLYILYMGTHAVKRAYGWPAARPYM